MSGWWESIVKFWRRIRGGQPDFPDFRPPAPSLTSLQVFGDNTPMSSHELGKYMEIQQILGNQKRMVNGPHQILPHVWLGDGWDAKDTAALDKLGITHILNCAGTTVITGAHYYRPGIGYLQFDARDAEKYLMTQHADDAIKFLDDVAKAGGRCLVHCMGGINRSGFLVIAYVMTHRQMALVASVRHVKKKRGILLDNESFQKQLVRFASNRGLLDFKSSLAVLQEDE